MRKKERGRVKRKEGWKNKIVKEGRECEEKKGYKNTH